MEPPPAPRPSASLGEALKAKMERKGKRPGSQIEKFEEVRASGGAHHGQS